MKGQNIGFKEEIWKIIPKLSLLPPLIWSTEIYELIGRQCYKRLTFRKPCFFLQQVIPMIKKVLKVKLKNKTIRTL